MPENQKINFLNLISKNIANKYNAKKALKSIVIFYHFIFYFFSDFIS